MKLTSEEILKKIEENKKILKKYKVKKIGLFGSFLKNTAKKTSDIDILVTFEKKTFDNYIELKLFLEKTFKKKVDLVVSSSLKKSLYYIKKEVKYAKVK